MNTFATFDMKYIYKRINMICQIIYKGTLVFIFLDVICYCLTNIIDVVISNQKNKTQNLSLKQSKQSIGYMFINVVLYQTFTIINCNDAFLSSVPKPK